LKKESEPNFKLPGKKITSFKRNVLVEKFLGQNSTSIFTKQKPQRNNKAQIGLTQIKNFEVVKLCGDTEYFHNINRRF